jgi:hypothetical protein
MSRELTLKQEKFAKEYAKTGNATKSALKVYDTDDYRVANNIGSENLAKPSIQKAIKSIADMLPNSLLTKVHLEGLKASDIQYDTEGNIVREKPDYGVRHKYLDTAYKLKNLYPKEGGNTAIQINVNTDRQEFA